MDVLDLIFFNFFLSPHFFFVTKKLIKMNQSSIATITNLNDVIDLEIMNYNQKKEFIKVILGKQVNLLFSGTMEFYVDDYPHLRLMLKKDYFGLY